MKKLKKEAWSHGLASTNQGLEALQEQQQQVVVSASPKTDIYRTKKLVELVSELDEVKRQLALLEKENDALKAQLNSKDALFKRLTLLVKKMML